MTAATTAKAIALEKISNPSRISLPEKLEMQQTMPQLLKRNLIMELTSRNSWKNKRKKELLTML
jgi:hypothetical protein